MRGGVYWIRNKIDNYIYIGSSVNLHNRRCDHARMLKYSCHHSVYLQRAVNKHGLKNFKFKILFICDPNMLLYYEQVCMDSWHSEYNMCRIAGSPAGIKRSEETKQRLSDAMKGKKLSEEAKHKISDVQKGHKLSEEAKHKISDANKGNKYCLGYKLSEETKHKISDALTGRKLSEDTRRKMSEAAKRNWINVRIKPTNSPVITGAD